MVGIEVCTNRMLTLLFVLDRAAYVTLFHIYRDYTAQLMQQF